MIEIECVRCHHNIDEYERVSLVLINNDMQPVHDTCERPEDVHEHIKLSEITQRGLVTMLYTFIVLKDQQHVLMRENANLRAELEGMRQEVIQKVQMNAEVELRLTDLQRRYDEQRNAIRALWRDDATPV
jgi:predicted RNase H-like nuclease (RuvC/YqgF family)